MSVTLKNCSEDIVSSTYRIPVVDLSSDDEKLTSGTVQKAMEKGKHVHRSESPVAHQKCAKRLKFDEEMVVDLDKVDEGKATNCVQLTERYASAVKNKWNGGNTSPVVIDVDSSDVSSG